MIVVQLTISSANGDDRSLDALVPLASCSSSRMVLFRGKRASDRGRDLIQELSSATTTSNVLLLPPLGLEEIIVYRRPADCARKGNSKPAARRWCVVCWLNSVLATSTVVVLLD
jgi:hypothetical protein